MPPPRLAIQSVGPNGQIQLIPIDPDTPEGRDLLNRAQSSEGLGSIVQLDEETERQLAVEQDITRRRGELGGNAAEAFLAGGLGAVDEATLGIPSALLQDASPEAARQLEAIRRESPTANLAGRVVGGIAPAVLSGGESVLARGARAVPSSLTQQAGDAMEGLLMERLLARGVSPEVARALSFAGGATLDGALSGGVGTVTEANIQGTPLEAEQVMANSLFGAGLGLGVGGLFGANALRRGLGGLGRRQLQQLEEVGVIEPGTIDPELGIPMRPPAQANDPLTNLMARSPVINTPGGEEAFRVVAADPSRAFDIPGYQSSIGQSTRDLEAAVNQIDSTAGNILENGDARRRYIQSNIDVPESNTAGMAMIVQEQRTLLNMVRPASRRSAGAVRAAREIMDGLATEIDGVASPGTVLAAFDRAIERSQLDNLLRGAQDDLAASNAIRSAFGGLNDAGEFQQGALLSAAARGGGRAGQDLSRVHSIRARFNGSRADSLTRFGRDTTRQGYAVNQANVDAALSHSMYKSRENTVRFLDRFLRDADEYAEVAGRFGANPEQLAVARGQIRRTANQIGDSVDWGNKVGAARFLSADESQNAGIQAAFGLSGVGTGALVGGALGTFMGPVGTAVGALAGGAIAAFTHPIGALRLMSGIKRSIGSSQVRLADGLGRVRRNLLGPKAVERVGRGAGRAARQVPRIVLALKSPAEREEQYNTMVGQVQRLASNPQALIDAVTRISGPIGQANGPLGMYIAERYTAGIQYLMSTLPPADMPSVFGHLDDLTPSLTEIDSWTRKVEAIEDPIGILDLAANYEITTDHVDAVRAVYPELYTLIQTELANMISDSERLPPYAARVQLATVLGIPTDRSFEDSFIHAMQSQYAQTQQQDQTLRGPQQTTQLSQTIATDTYTEAQSVTLRM